MSRFRVSPGAEIIGMTVRHSEAVGSGVADTVMLSVRLSIFMEEIPSPVVFDGHQVVVGVDHGVARGSISNFEIQDIPVRAIQNPVAIAGTRAETRAHARGKFHVAIVRMQRRTTLQNKYEFLLAGMGVPQ